MLELWRGIVIMRKGQNCYWNVTIQEAIERAKIKIINLYDQGNCQRKWLTADLDSYGSKSNRVKILVREGSPHKGFIVVDYGFGVVFAFDAWNNMIFRWHNLINKEESTI